MLSKLGVFISDVVGPFLFVFFRSLLWQAFNVLVDQASVEKNCLFASKNEAEGACLIGRSGQYQVRAAMRYGVPCRAVALTEYIVLIQPPCVHRFIYGSSLSTDCTIMSYCCVYHIFVGDTARCGAINSTPYLKRLCKKCIQPPCVYLSTACRRGCVPDLVCDRTRCSCLVGQNAIRPQCVHRFTGC